MADDDPQDSSDEVFVPVLDQIYELPDQGEYVLVVVEERPLSDPAVIDHLASRINLCVQFVLDGDLAAELPETQGRRIRIHVDHLAPADADAEAFFVLVADRLAERGIGFSSHHLDEDPPAPRAPRP